MKSINEKLNFLITDYGFQELEKKNVAYEYSLILRNKYVELAFLSSIGSISLPDIVFKISKREYDLNNLSYQNKLKEIYKSNYNRTNPISEKVVNKYVRERKYNETELIRDVEKRGQSDIDELIKEISKIFKDNPTILKGDKYPFFKAKLIRIKSQLTKMRIKNS